MDFQEYQALEFTNSMQIMAIYMTRYHAGMYFFMCCIFIVCVFFIFWFFVCTNIYFRDTTEAEAEAEFNWVLGRYTIMILFVLWHG